MAIETPAPPANAEQTAESEIVSLGRKLRELRRARELSLNDVAAEANISISMLSQLERGVAAPSLATLHALAQFYDTRLFELFQEAGPPNGALVRRHERAIVHLPRSDATYELISGIRQDLQLVEMTLTRAQGSTDHTLSHPVGSSRVDLQACKLEYSIVSPK